MKNMFFLILFLFSTVAIAQKNEPLLIGCATKCSFLYSHALKRIAKLSGIPISIIDLSKRADVSLEDIDGLVIPGGADIDPKYYLPFVEEELQEYTKSLDHLVEYSQEGRIRDPFEYELLQSYFRNSDLQNLPILGICRGMQMLAVSQGMPLYVDIKTELGIRNRRYLFDRIFVNEENSLMKELFPSLTFLGFEQHHQGIRVDYYLKNQARWPNLRVSSYSNRGTIAESREHGVQGSAGSRRAVPPRKRFWPRKKINLWLVAGKSLS
ncbi:MAG TPA: gamma-glutamyl-gamma-aminobutyrate hydrolase family protein [Bacteriovoracaceae bacterium]|nr:gamma-glutamyl-gamma-aminobutyrate hydrolase family protein [Bacteriovoracaceae bacterium]